MKKLSILFIGLLILSGCATTPMLWYKPGASQDEFSRVRYNCLQQAQQPASGAYVNAYAGSASSRVITNDQLFGACMNANGWSLRSANQAQTMPQTNSSSVPAVQEEVKQAMLAIKAENEAR